MKTEPGPGPVSTCHCPESRQEMKACDSPVEFSDLIQTKKEIEKTIFLLCFSVNHSVERAGVVRASKLQSIWREAKSCI